QRERKSQVNRAQFLGIYGTGINRVDLKYTPADGEENQKPAQPQPAWCPRTKLRSLDNTLRFFILSYAVRLRFLGSHGSGDLFPGIIASPGNGQARTAGGLAVSGVISKRARSFHAKPAADSFYLGGRRSFGTLMPCSS